MNFDSLTKVLFSVKYEISLQGLQPLQGCSLGFWQFWPLNSSYSVMPQYGGMTTKVYVSRLRETAEKK